MLLKVFFARWSATHVHALIWLISIAQSCGYHCLIILAIAQASLWLSSPCSSRKLITSLVSVSSIIDLNPHSHATLRPERTRRTYFCWQAMPLHMCLPLQSPLHHHFSKLQHNLPNFHNKSSIYINIAFSVPPSGGGHAHNVYQPLYDPSC